MRIYKNLILFSKKKKKKKKKGGPQIVVSLRDRWRDILREGTSCPISSYKSQGVPMLAPPCRDDLMQRRPNASDQLRSLARLDSLASV